MSMFLTRMARLLLLLGLAWPGVADTVSWTGAVSQDWEDGGNWNSSAVPTNTDDAWVIIREDVTMPDWFLDDDNTLSRLLVRTEPDSNVTASLTVYSDSNQWMLDVTDGVVFEGALIRLESIGNNFANLTVSNGSELLLTYTYGVFSGPTFIESSIFDMSDTSIDFMGDVVARDAAIGFDRGGIIKFVGKVDIDLLPHPKGKSFATDDIEVEIQGTARFSGALRTSALIVVKGGDVTVENLTGPDSLIAGPILIERIICIRPKESFGSFVLFEQTIEVQQGSFICKSGAVRLTLGGQVIVSNGSAFFDDACTLTLFEGPSLLSITGGNLVLNATTLFVYFAAAVEVNGGEFVVMDTEIRLYELSVINVRSGSVKLLGSSQLNFLVQSWMNITGGSLLIAPTVQLGFDSDSFIVNDGLLIGGFGASGAVTIQNQLHGQIILNSDTHLSSSSGNLTNLGQIFVESSTVFDVVVANTGLLNITGIAEFAHGLSNSGTLYVVPHANGTLNFGFLESTGTIKIDVSNVTLSPGQSLEVFHWDTLSGTLNATLTGAPPGQENCFIVQQTGKSLVLLFDPACAQTDEPSDQVIPPSQVPAIVGGVIGGVLGAAVIGAAIVMSVPSLRAKVLPYSVRQQQDPSIAQSAGDETPGNDSQATAGWNQGQKPNSIVV